MKVKMILPALTEAKSPFWRPIKYSLFPPLGLATLAGYLDPDDEIDLQDDYAQAKLDYDQAVKQAETALAQIAVSGGARTHALIAGVGAYDDPSIVPVTV